MEKWVGRVALVTGASVGTGAAITRALVKHGLKVVGCARNVQQIEMTLKISALREEALEVSGPNVENPIIMID
uniref:Dehydrogenase/reductase SDR family member 11 n=1 Tax=Magallana gigas TaxID=29159 RepID=K1RD03_MAGGI